MKKSLLLLLALALMLPLTAGAQVQKIMGHYENDSINPEGISVTTSGTMPEGIKSRGTRTVLSPSE